MKRTKREENSIIITTFIFVLLTIVLSIYFISFIIPGFNDVKLLKKDTEEVYSNYSRILKNGLSLDEFNTSVTTILSSSSEKKGDSDYISEILKSIDEDFYTKTFINSNEENFDAFIFNLSKNYSDINSFNDKIELISKILPIYSEDVNYLGEEGLSDYKFINYIESIVETFNLSYKDPIGISELKILEEYNSVLGDNSLTTNIFYIPLKIEITGSKSSILDFLYFIDNVGKIKINDSGDKSISLNYKTDKDFSDFKTKLLRGQTRSGDYGIFTNQIFDAASIKFDKYLDSSFNIDSNSNSFIGYLKSSQGNEKIKADIELRFYVKGIPLYKIENQIKNFVSDFNKIKVDVQKKLSIEGSSNNIKFVEMNSSLNQIQLTVIPELQKALGTKKLIDEAYKQVIKYNKLIEEYKQFLK